MAATGLFEYSENSMEGRAQGSSRWRWLLFLALLFVGLAFYHLSIYERLTELNDSWEREKQIELRLESIREENARLEAAIDDLFRNTSTVAHPWHVVAANDKKYARLTALGLVVKYLAKGVDLTPVDLDPDFARHARATLGLSGGGIEAEAAPRGRGERHSAT